jgi:hypothetical protein
MNPRPDVLNPRPDLLNPRPDLLSARTAGPGLKTPPILPIIE